MGETTGFLKWGRETPTRRPVPVRLRDWREVYEPFPEETLKLQAGRCMDCGIPFCNNGCPLGNLIPDWNDLVYRDHWRDAIERLHATNNFPEFTGRLCPAPCEAACVLGISQDPVTIKQVEVEIVERAWNEGWIEPVVPDGAHRPQGRRRRLRSRRARRRAAAHARGPLGGRVRARRPHRRSAALRHPRVQDGEAPPRPSPRADGGRGHRVPRERRRRRRRQRRRPARGVRRHRARRWRHRVARPPDPRSRARRHPPGDGVPALGQPGAARRPRRAADHRGGQARRDHRRRRHRRRLPGHVAPPGRGVDPPVRDPARARPTRVRRPTRGPRGRTSSGCRRRTKRAASASTASTPSASSPTTTATCARCVRTRSR